MLVIHSYPGASEIVRLLWPYYDRAGWPLLGVETEDGYHEWPREIPTVRIGRNAYVEDRRNLPERLLRTMEHCLELSHDDFAIIEYDTLILEPLGQHPGGLATHLAGGQLPGVLARQFFHCPWWFDKPTARQLVETGRTMLDRAEYEGGSPDVFLGRAVDLSGVGYTELGTFSVNSFDRKQDIESGRAAIREGCRALHGVKNRQQLEALLA